MDSNEFIIDTTILLDTYAEARGDGHAWGGRQGTVTGEWHNAPVGGTVENPWIPYTVGVDIPANPQVGTQWAQVFYHQVINTGFAPTQMYINPIMFETMYS